MKSTPECIACFVRQAWLTASQVTGDPARIFAAVQEGLKNAGALSMDATPPENTRHIVDAAIAYLGAPDPFYRARVDVNNLALQAYNALRQYVFRASNPLEAAVRVAASGNILDLAILKQVDFTSLLAEAQQISLTVNHIERLQRDITSARSILILGDNAGEIVFDLPLAELLSAKTVYYAVKSGPAANDVTFEDAAQVGMERFARVIGTGSAYQGTPLAYCSREFMEVFNTADIIIAKGQGNYETLSEVNANLYFVLKVKCQPVADALNVSIGDILLKAQQA